MSRVDRRPLLSVSATGVCQQRRQSGITAWMSWESVAYDELDLLLAPAIQILSLAVVFVGVEQSDEAG